MKVKSEREVAQSWPILSDPMDFSLPGSSIHGIFQAGVLEWGAIAFAHGIRDGKIRERRALLTTRGQCWTVDSKELSERWVPW